MNLFRIRAAHIAIFCLIVQQLLRVEDVAAEIQIPQQSDWTDHGSIAQPGGWDNRFVGGFSPCAVVKKNGTYFVYYIGANGGRPDDNGPAFRALGVLTSTDGINFTKYSGNPIITHWEPEGHVNAAEAGVFTAGATVDDNGDILLYVGAMTAIGTASVNDDGKLYVSTNGLDFTLVGTVLDHADPSVWGSGDEIDPFGVVRSPVDGRWHMYYSVASSWLLAHQSGPSRDFFDSNTSGPVIIPGADIVGGADPILIGPNEVAIFVDRADGSPTWSHWFTEVRTISLDSPKTASDPVAVYDFEDTMGTTVYLDLEVGKWLMFYNKGTEQFTNNSGEGTVIGLRTASLITDGSLPRPPTIIED